MLASKHVLVFLPPRNLLRRTEHDQLVSEDGEDARPVKIRRLALLDVASRNRQSSAEPSATSIDRRPSPPARRATPGLDLSRDSVLDDLSTSKIARSQEASGPAPLPTPADDATVPEEEGHSLAPPPSLHFALNRITSIADIVARPERFQGHPDGPAFAARPRLNLLVLVREVGPLEQYEVKSNNAGKGSSTSAAASRWLPPAQGYRSHLVVCDRDGALLTVTLWDRCARMWAGDEDDQGGQADASRSRTTDHGRSQEDTAQQTKCLEGDASGSISKSITTQESGSTSRGLDPPPRALRPGDVVYLTKLILSRPKDATLAHGDGSKPNPALQRYITSTSIKCSTTTESDVQLCFRSDVRSRRDEAYAYIGPDRVVGSDLEGLAAFDAHCRAVWQLARRWF